MADRPMRRDLKGRQGYDGEVFAGDRDRERATAVLREHYVGGRLTLDEVSERIGRVLAARSQAELRSALAGLPGFPEACDLAARGRSVARSAIRAAALVVFTGAYLLFSMTLLLVFGLTLLLQGASGSMLLGFLLVWLVPTYFLTRLWRRKEAR
jgi:Domain of unknown function (DUF1707)